MLDVLRCWDLVEADLHERYGIDTDSGILTERTWRWLVDRITALFHIPPAVTFTPDGQPIEVQQTRIAHHMFPPRKE